MPSLAHCSSAGSSDDTAPLFIDKLAMTETDLRRRMARWRRVRQTTPLDLTGGWRLFKPSRFGVRRRIFTDTFAIEISAELKGDPVSSRNMIMAVRFLDEQDRPILPPAKPLRFNEVEPGYVYPFELRIEDAFRLVVRPPGGAQLVEVEFFTNARAPQVAHAFRDLLIRPLSSLDEGLDMGDPSNWAEGRRLMASVLRFGEALGRDSAGLYVADHPFGEAVLEHFVLTTQHTDLARVLAERRLIAGRDREAAVLAELTDFPALAAAISRRALLDWASDHLAPWSGGPPVSGAVFLVAQNLSASGRTRLSADEKAYEGRVEVFSTGGFAGAAPAIDVGVFEPADAKGCVTRLADLLVRKGRGREVAVLRAFSMTDALAAATAGRRLKRPTQYVVSDIDQLRAAVEVEVGEAAQREGELYKLAFSAVDEVVLECDQDRLWLIERGFNIGSDA